MELKEFCKTNSTFFTFFFERLHNFRDAFQILRVFRWVYDYDSRLKKILNRNCVVLISLIREEVVVQKVFVNQSTYVKKIVKTYFACALALKNLLREVLVSREKFFFSS